MKFNQSVRMFCANRSNLRNCVLTSYFHFISWQDAILQLWIHRSHRLNKSDKIYFVCAIEESRETTSDAAIYVAVSAVCTSNNSIYLFISIFVMFRILNFRYHKFLGFCIKSSRNNAKAWMEPMGDAKNRAAGDWKRLLLFSVIAPVHESCWENVVLVYL